MSPMSTAVGGHVNMMMDVLIAQLPPAELRAACRHLLSTHPSLASELGEFVRQSRLARPIYIDGPATILPSPDTVSPELLDCLLQIRLSFLTGLHLQALRGMSYLLGALVERKAEWTTSPSAVLLKALKQAEGDMIQCMQSIKESYPPHGHGNADLKTAILELLDSFRACFLSFDFNRAYYQTVDTFHLLFPNDPRPEAPAPMSVLSGQLQPGVRTSTIPTLPLGPIQLPRLLIGLWQLSSPAWGSASYHDLNSSLMDLVSHGFRAADMADHYGDAEIIFGEFRKTLVGDVSNEMLTCSKWCVFGKFDREVTRDWVRTKVDERRSRCGGYLDLLQFHWQDYSDKTYLNVLYHLVSISREEPHLVKAIGLVNFDAETTDEICTYLKGKLGDVGVISNQVQYSLIDQRPRFLMADVCKKHGIKLLTYGTYCGGFLADKWLGKTAPDLYADQITPSQRKYFDMIMLWGTWDLFQDLLKALRAIADTHGRSIDIANIAARWVLEKDEVASVIVGTRLGVSSNVESNTRVFSLSLTEDDHAVLGAVLERSKARGMLLGMGDCGAEYRHATH